ncbi:MAG: GH36-type glycosyl hydrolase domain-containing protein, partial [Planctomycetota bacterium]
YLRDDDSGVCWSPTYGPLNEPLDEFVCEHNLSFTEIRASKDGISSALRYFVPMEGLFEVWHLVLRNESESTRRLSAFALTGWELTGFPHARYYYNRVFTTSYHVEKLNGIFAHSDNPYAPHKRYKAFLSCSEELSGHDGFLPAFLGGAGSPARPAALLEGRDCTGSQTACYGKGAVLQNKLVLEPGETKELTYCLGVCASEDEAAESLKTAFAEGYLEEAIAETEAYWEKMIARCSVKTPEDDFDAVMNVWLKKQMMYCRVEKKGVRDNMQIADGVVQIFPECGRAEVLEVLAHQFQDGHTVLTWYPYDDTYYSDQPMWLVMGVAGYIRETGDFGILNEVVPYQDGGEGTVWEHLKAGLELKQTDLGPNGLCRIRYADWNDSLNILTDDNAESVFVTAGLGYMLKEMAELADRAGEKEFADECRKNHAIVADKMNRIAWDGEYYARALHKDGVVGGHKSEGSKIFSNPQSWAIIAELVPDDRLPSVLKAMDERCEHDFGLLVNAPVYDKYTRTLGRISAFPPGLYENGVYCHATGFAIVANACRTASGIRPWNRGPSRTSSPATT